MASCRVTIFLLLFCLPAVFSILSGRRSIEKEIFQDEGDQIRLSKAPVARRSVDEETFHRGRPSADTEMFHIDDDRLGLPPGGR